MSAYGTFPHSEPYWHTEQGSSGAGAANPGNIPKAPTSFSALSDSRAGKSNPNWKRQIAKGANATTPFTGVLQTLESNPSVTEYFYIVAFPLSNPNNWRQTRKTWSHGMQTNMPTLPSISDVAEATQKAQTTFYKDLESVMTLFQGGVFLGELRETLQMIRNPARSLRRRLDDYLSDAKKRRRGSSKVKENVLAGLWLEHAFGWAPLLNDLNTARDYLDRKQEQLAQALQPVTGSGTVQKASVVNTSNAVGSTTLTAELQRVDITFVRYKGAVASRVASKRMIEYDAMGLSARSFVPTIWELVPWSFAIDYFSNIGDVLTAWANQTVGLSWGCETVRRKRYLYSRNCRQVFSFPSFPSITLRSASSGWTGASHKRVDRAPITYVPVPSIQFEIPGFGKKWLNLAALAASRRALTPY